VSDFASEARRASTTTKLCLAGAHQRQPSDNNSHNIALNCTLTYASHQQHQALGQLPDSVHTCAPLQMRIKAAIKNLQEELAEAEVRIGVVSHTLMQLSVKNKRLLQSHPTQPSLSDEDD